MSHFIHPNTLRAHWRAALSDTFCQQVPAYAQLRALVATVNDAPTPTASLPTTPVADTLHHERHGAIRLGSATELRHIARLFALMGMAPVGYYDLSAAGLPVHATAFRPTRPEDLRDQPFRIFTSLLRPDAIADATLRDQVTASLADRCIFSPRLEALVTQAEQQGGVSAPQAAPLIAESMDTFRWHAQARVDQAFYDLLSATHPVIADVTAFHGPHINHLAPAVLDIDLAQRHMRDAGLPVKHIIEGPPRRHCPILLRQTAFHAQHEPVQFPTPHGEVTGRHTARFGEIEQRGIALTPKGHALYDDRLRRCRRFTDRLATDDPAPAYRQALVQAFADFPDDLETLRREQLAYVEYVAADPATLATHKTLDDALACGAVTYRGITYEDFLPVSAAGIFRANLGEHTSTLSITTGHQAAFEAALGRPVIDPFALYAQQQHASLKCLGFDASGRRAQCPT